VLPLSEVEYRHYGGFLVLRGVSRENLFDELLILRRELEGYRGVVDVCIPVLFLPLAAEGERRGSTYDHEVIAPPHGCGAERPPLGPLELAKGPGSATKGQRGQLRGHCGCVCALVADGGDGTIEDVNDLGSRGVWPDQSAKTSFTLL
jgi:hypothetical protein